MKYFTEEQVEDLVRESSKETYAGENRRWSRSMTSIVEDCDGKLYRVFWEDGLTESQENFYESGNHEEVFKFVENIGTVSTKYITAARLASLDSSNKEKLKNEVSSLNVVASEEDIKQEVSTIDKGSIENMLDLINNINLLNINKEMQVNHSVTLKYLNSLLDVKKLIEEKGEF